MDLNSVDICLIKQPEMYCNLLSSDYAVRLYNSLVTRIFLRGFLNVHYLKSKCYSMSFL